MKVKLPQNLSPGQHVFAVSVEDFSGPDPIDPYFAITVRSP